MFLPPTITSLDDAAIADWETAGAAMKVMASATAMMNVFIRPFLLHQAHKADRPVLALWELTLTSGIPV